MSEFPRPIRLDALSDVPRRMELVADAAERAALAGRFALVALDRLVAELELRREGEVVHLTGTLRAEAIQSCVASAADVAAVIAEPFALIFVPESDVPAAEIELDDRALDTLTYEGVTVDIGEAVAQTLGLALDPYPRAPDADSALRAAGVKSEGEAGPFGILAQFKREP